MRVARRYVLAGRVQGVGFRYFTVASASREGIHGWVRNRRDGAVEVAAEGEAEAVERFERSIRQGPPGARVESIETEETVPAWHETGFVVR
jgi:acylphosphatase